MAHTIFEEFKVSGNQLLNRVKQLVKEGNVRRIMVKDRNGRTLIETPLSLGIIGAGGLLVMAPLITAIAGAAIFASDARVIVERYANKNGDENEINRDYIEIDIEDDDKK
ncbi:MAG: DUF4342 domain-containing protein [Balneolales bacterium]